MPCSTCSLAACLGSGAKAAVLEELLLFFAGLADACALLVSLCVLMGTLGLPEGSAAAATVGSCLPFSAGCATTRSSSV